MNWSRGLFRARTVSFRARSRPMISEMVLLNTSLALLGILPIHPAVILGGGVIPAVVVEPEF